MSVSSEDSLAELPLPFDISSAVNRALRISSFSEAQPAGGAQEGYCPEASQSLPGFDRPCDELRPVNDGCYPPDYCYMQEYHSLPPYYHYSTGPIPPNYPNQPSICDASGLMSMDSSTSLEQYYDFGDMSCPPYNGRSQSCSYSSTFYPSEACPPPKKMRRNTIQYCETEMEFSSINDCRDDFSDWPWAGRLENSSLWQRFDEVGTEMVVTKGGRRMFPHLEVSFQNLDPGSLYAVEFEMVPCDGKRYKFLKTEWVPTGRAEKKQTLSVYEHPESPNTGSYWMSKPVTFKMVKLTNNKMTKFKDQIILNSMQKYQPHIRLTDKKLGGSKSFSFPETTFIAVTAYQNSLMTQMKIDHNPYARAFREGDQSGLCPTEKKGGHYDRFRKSSSSSPPHQKRGKQSSSSPGHSTSATSVDLSCEGSNSTLPEKNSPALVADKTVLLSSMATSHSLSYWADDNSLWNPNLITPDPLMDSTSSFSEPYLQQTTQVELVYDVSPIKGLFDIEEASIPQEPHCAYILDTVTDDDVFL